MHWMHCHDSDIETAISNTAQSKVKICFDTEWPIYFEGHGRDKKKVQGTINIVQLGSNVTNYTLILELYNFKDNAHHMRAIAQKLKAIFCLKVHCFTGCGQKGDYARLRRQYTQFDFPEENCKLFDDVSVMANGNTPGALSDSKLVLKKARACQSW